MRFIIHPYLLDDGHTWAFDDPLVGLMREPFVRGASEIISALAARRVIFRIVFSDEPLMSPNAKVLRLIGPEDDGNLYEAIIDGAPMVGWLCPALFKYFKQAPKIIYFAVFTDKPSYFTMIQDDIVGISRIVDKLYESGESGQHVTWCVDIRKRLDHLEQCLDMAAAQLQDAHTRSLGDFEI